MSKQGFCGGTSEPRIPSARSVRTTASLLGMPSVESPSPLLGAFVRTAEKSFPPDQRKALASYSEEIERSTSKRDHERARHCALWAIEHASAKHQGHPRWREVKELHQIWKDTWFGAEFGSFGPSGHLEPREEVRIQWVEDAVDVAAKLGEEDGWANSPWEVLLRELLQMES